MCVAQSLHLKKPHARLAQGKKMTESMGMKRREERKEVSVKGGILTAQTIGSALEVILPQNRH